MPIKLPKAFPRRKSSGNALEDLSAPSEPSFRVLERPPSHSFDGADTLRRMSQGRPLSADHPTHVQGGNHNNLNAVNRASGTTNNSASSGGHDNSSSSARFSSSSTLPSSTDINLDDKPFKDPTRMPAPPIPESTGIASLKAAGRAFSFGRKKAETTVHSPRPFIEHANSDGRAYYSRERTHTESSCASQSTATPPKLLDTGLDFGSSDNFGTMFDGIGTHHSQTEPDKALRKSEISHRAVENTSAPKGYATPPLNSVTSAQQGEASQMSRVNYGSQDDLNSNHSPAMERTFSYEDGQEIIESTSQRAKPRMLPASGPSSPSYRRRQQRPPSDGLRRSSVYANRKDFGQSPTDFQDDDAKLVMDSINASRRLDSGGAGSYQDSDDEDNPSASLVASSKLTPSQQVSSGADQDSVNDYSGHRAGIAPQQPASRAGQRGDVLNTGSRAASANPSYSEERSMFDISPPPSARCVPTPQPKTRAAPKPQTQNKVMTPAQFERYRKQQEMNRVANSQADKDSSDEEADDYDDDDELERTKQLAKERRKQEAHLAVYRQQMMKVTGEQPSDMPNVNVRPSMDRASASTPNIPNRSNGLDINFDKFHENSKLSDEEDEDVPLGVLAAHGFPSKTRPPTAMSIRDSRIQYKSESYPPPPASTSGVSQSGRASGLPPFAKHLPHDPYFGASLVNITNRESLAFGHQGPPSSYGAPAPDMNPGGLVGVIAGEEKAKAARRGSPNTHGSYGSPLPPGMTQLPGMPPGIPPMMTPGEQATMQMSEQMNQMMQMQVQWMQQMQQMVASGMQIAPGQPQPLFPTHPSMMMPPMLNPGPGHNPRPISSPHTLSGAHAGQIPGGRAMSMMSPSPNPPWTTQNGSIGRGAATPSATTGMLRGSGPGYAPSIAPSERSNVGNPSRYRPVSIAPAEEQQLRSKSRASTMNSNTLHPMGLSRDDRQSNSQDRKSKLAVQSVSRTPPGKPASDDDDEEGWEEMKKKREKKKGMWRLNKKKEEPLVDAAGLEYYDYSEI